MTKYLWRKNTRVILTLVKVMQVRWLRKNTTRSMLQPQGTTNQRIILNCRINYTRQNLHVMITRITIRKTTTVLGKQMLIADTSCMTPPYTIAMEQTNDLLRRSTNRETHHRPTFSKWIISFQRARLVE